MLCDGNLSENRVKGFSDMFTCDSSAVVHELANGGGGSERITSVMFALQEVESTVVSISFKWRRRWMDSAGGVLGSVCVDGINALLFDALRSATQSLGVYK